MAERTVPITSYDDKKRRCPKLGHEVAFEYCRSESDEIPCERTLTCWWDDFDVADFVRQHFTDDQIAHLHGPQQQKMSSLVGSDRPGPIAEEKGR